MENLAVQESIISISGELLNVKTPPKKKISKKKTVFTEPSKADVTDELVTTKKSRKSPKPPLDLVYNDRNRFEIGIDEAGRGPLFGRLYVAGVVLPKTGTLDPSFIRDSKTLSAKKRKEMSDYIKEHAIAYHIHFTEPNVIDKINIRQAVLKGMRESVLECRKNVLDYMAVKPPVSTVDISIYDNEFFAMIDGDDFPPCMLYEETNGKSKYTEIPHETFVGGDNRYMSIAAASILAKVARDEYVQELCKRHPPLVERYGMDTHMGYGTKKHLEGIVKYGISQYHRRTYGCCKSAELNVV